LSGAGSVGGGSIDDDEIPDEEGLVIATIIFLQSYFSERQFKIAQQLKPILNFRERKVMNGAYHS
jgi:hypothetical protein